MSDDGINALSCSQEMESSVFEMSESEPSQSESEELLQCEESSSKQFQSEESDQKVAEQGDDQVGGCTHHASCSRGL